VVKAADSVTDKEIEIIHQLAVKVLEHEDMLAAASDTCGELDCLVALAVGAKRYKLRPPQMTTANIIEIQEGRHPLQELVVPSFIPNDCHLAGANGKQPIGTLHQGDSTPSMVILTGPNHSGKSVYLKQVALIVYMSHIGSYVPAERAVIGLTDKLLTRMATRESVSRDESAFAIDLRQAAFSINFATRRSLVLIDEFGKGTNATDGAALLAALLNHFITLDDERRPKVLAATHFHEIFENNFLECSPRVGFAHMDVHLDVQAAAEDQVTFLYQLVPGRSTSSYGSRCAEMNGVDEAVVERSEAIILIMSRGEDLEAACAKLSEEEMVKLREAENVARRFLQWAIENPSQPRELEEREAPGVRNQLRQALGDESSSLS